MIRQPTASRFGPAASPRELDRVGRSGPPGRGAAASEAPRLAARSVVVEFLGISGSGKSTLARSLAARFEQAGYRARLLTMQRRTMLGRLLGMVCKSGNLYRFAFGDRSKFDEVQSVLRLFPQKNAFSSARLLMYLSYVVAARSRIAANCQATISDQGIAQAVYSLALFSDASGVRQFAEALSLLPKPDILITLDVPVDTASERLMRRRGHARLARITDHDGKILNSSLNSIEQIEHLLMEHGCHVVRYRPAHSASIEQSTDELFQTLGPVVGRAVSRVGLRRARKARQTHARRHDF